MFNLSLDPDSERLCEHGASSCIHSTVIVIYSLAKHHIGTYHWCRLGFLRTVKRKKTKRKTGVGTN